MKQIRTLVFVSITSACFATSHASANSSDLMTLYQQATGYDTEIAAAKASFLAEQQGENIALAGLLPTLNTSASIGHTNSNGTSFNNSTSLNDNISSNSDYQTTRYTVTLTQPIFNQSNWYNLSASELSTLRAQSIYFAAQQDLILKVASAYFNVLREKENLKTARSQEAAVKRQYEQAREQFDVGLIAITDVHEAKATYDASQTNRIRSEGNLTVAIENLSRLTGQYTPELATLQENFPIQLDPSMTADAWVNAAFENNLSIKAAEFGLKSLEKQYQANRAQHLPTLSLNASYTNTEYSSPVDRETEDSTIFLTLNLPLYSGGATQANARQTLYLQEQAKHQLASTQRLVRVEARTEYINIKTNIQTVESLQQNIVSRESALEATREGYNVGTRNIVEVLDAERNYFSALRDYANARFDFIESNLRLRRAAGTLNAKDLEILNAWLEPERSGKNSE